MLLCLFPTTIIITTRIPFFNVDLESFGTFLSVTQRGCKCMSVFALFLNHCNFFSCYVYVRPSSCSFSSHI